MATIESTSLPSVAGDASGDLYIYYDVGSSGNTVLAFYIWFAAESAWVNISDFADVEYP